LVQVPVLVKTCTFSVEPLPDGVAHVPSPRQKVELEAPVPLFKLVTGRFPVTPPTPLAARFVAGVIPVP